MDRKNFLRGLVGLPIIAMLAPMALSGEQEAQSISGEAVSTSAELQPIIQRFASQGVPPDLTNYPTDGLDVTPAATYVSYGKDLAGDWAGYVEATDKSWISFIKNDGVTTAFKRLANGTLERIESR